jgi:hypothetical protein
VLGVPTIVEQPVMEMYGVPEHTMAHWIEDAGGRLISVFDWSKIAGQGTDWERRVFVLTKAP